jgi:hypothetical protein
MKTHYTPGPWKAHNIGANYWTVEADSPHVKGKLQTVCDINGPWDAENYKANALLIAAAPAMFIALQEMLCMFKDHRDYGDDEATAVKLALTAINLATKQ